MGETRPGVLSGLILNIQRFSIQDGPGIRTTVFLKGCPLGCVWCHNPESMSPLRQIVFLQNRCIGCGECGRHCPGAKIDGGERALPPGHEHCLLCGACIEACPTQARQMAGTEMTVQQVLAEVLQDRVFYEASGGGVTFSGGEPLAQPEFLRGLLAACRAHGLHTAVDTCGMARLEDLAAVAPLTDLFLYDLKMMDEEKHRRFTRVSNATILDNLRSLGRLHEQIWVRVPIIPGFNDSPADLEAAARFVAGIIGVRQVNLLPFHKTGLGKLRRLGRASEMSETEPPSVEAMDKALALFQSLGLAAKAGG